MTHKVRKAGSIQICDNKYSVTVENIIGENDSRMGETCFSEQWIKIHSDMSRNNVIATFAHEIAHNVFVEGGACAAMSTEQQEIACNIAGKVAEILFKNIDLTEKIVDMSEDF